MGKFVDLAGQKFGRLLVIEKCCKNKWGSITWKCRCDCGKESIIRSGDLRSGNTKSCGCNRFEVIDIKGQRFGRLLVEEFSHTENGRTYWKAFCDCGNNVIVRYCHLRDGSTKSCGCLLKDIYERYPYKLGAYKHGASVRNSKKRIYSIWCGMKHRCSSINSDSHKYYYDKGIKVCDEWQEFIPFKRWSLTHGYKEYLTIDRIDSDGNYCPENCQWITKSENSTKACNERWNNN
jgi:hypothetical protein